MKRADIERNGDAVDQERRTYFTRRRLTVALLSLFVTAQLQLGPTQSTVGCAAQETGGQLGAHSDRVTTASIIRLDSRANQPSFRVDAESRVCNAVAEENLAGWNVEGWQAYESLWNELVADPGNSTIRSYLGLPIGKTAAETAVVIKSGRGRSAPSWLGWRSGSYRQYETPHFQIFSHADDKTTRFVATDLERVYWAWTQMFFPLWDGRPQVALHLKDLSPQQSVASRLASRRARLSSRRKLRVVLLKDADDYARTLGRSTPGIEQSTGFYSDERQTSFFYWSESSDATASRRHELIHQLFREATRSRLSADSPGERSDFWLVEGIAGYFESLLVDQAKVTVGGWDSPRLQFARYRVLVSQDSMPLAELRSGGKSAVQRRADLARWYAFSIAYTHVLLDGNSAANRRWIYRQLAELYEIPVDVPPTPDPSSPERQLIDFLKVDDATLVQNSTSRQPDVLCLAGCSVSSQGLANLVADQQSSWIDLSRTAVVTNDVLRVLPRPSVLRQLSLEATRIDSTIHPWLAKATELRELDLSWTFCNDATVKSIAGLRELQTLWLTGSKVTDESLEDLAKLPKLESLDVQRTGVSAAGLADLKRRRPDIKLNPLMIREQ